MRTQIWSESLWGGELAWCNWVEVRMLFKLPQQIRYITRVKCVELPQNGEHWLDFSHNSELLVSLKENFVNQLSR
jgi:hypothetical protein